MKILFAEDDLTSRTLLSAALKKWGFDPVATEDGATAWEAMQQPEPPYIIMLTSMGEKKDIVLGLDAGANDYILKPYDLQELRARLGVGKRMVMLRSALVEQMRDLHKALEHIKTLHGILPICSYCKKIRDDKQYWHQIESYVSTHTDAQFSHSVCPECYEKHCHPMLEDLKKKGHLP